MARPPALKPPALKGKLPKVESHHGVNIRRVWSFYRFRIGPQELKPLLPQKHSSFQMKILIYDHAGHPFQVQLSRSLAARGHEVLHTFTAELQTPRGVLCLDESDPASLSIAPLPISTPFSRILKCFLLIL